ncbi:hypothetical protein BB560_002313 [Smittium megazygosporum]|uniref:Uncharacterized protein n=1 Tax=Smittium megazygosporum TaxID=133381 RepID=A0A2T9ZFB3_9FUNG|nr:hypothetical protein BB560_007079 [Smittium megazygosporum]PVV03227.1 hypothetical protein BB560_002313 [Smittium megazygosporum]
MSKVLFYFAIVLAMFVSLTQSLSVLKKAQKRSIEKKEQNRNAISNYIDDCKNLLGESGDLGWQKERATSLGKGLYDLIETGVSRKEYIEKLVEILKETGLYDFYEKYRSKMAPVINKLNQKVKDEYACLNEMIICLDNIYIDEEKLNDEIFRNFFEAIKGTDQNGIDPYKCNQDDYVNTERTLLRGNYSTENDVGNNVWSSLQGVERDDICTPTDEWCIYENECKKKLGSTTGDSDWAEKKAIGLAKGIYDVVSKKVFREDIIQKDSIIQNKITLPDIIYEYKLKLINEINQDKVLMDTLDCFEKKILCLESLYFSNVILNEDLKSKIIDTLNKGDVDGTYYIPKEVCTLDEIEAKRN